jgi:hypothetical protein
MSINEQGVAVSWIQWWSQREAFDRDSIRWYINLRELLDSSGILRHMI